jgi:hypothetical protein
VRSGQVLVLWSTPRSRSTAFSRRPVFVKETTGKRYPEVLGDEKFMARDAVHTFLIRHPREIIASRYPLDPDAPIEKVGFESLFEIFTEAARLTGHDPVVIDAADLVATPAAIVRAYCERIGITFMPQALTWSPGDRPEWKLSGRWHAEAAASAGFTPPPTSGNDLDVDVERHPVLNSYLARHLPLYAELRARRLTA